MTIFRRCIATHQTAHNHRTRQFWLDPPIHSGRTLCGNVLPILATLSLLTGLIVALAPAASAAVTTYACNPSSTGWNVKGRWDDGTVLEARTCLQYDTAFGQVRTKSEWRVRKGGTAISGTDWDLDANATKDPRFQIWVYSDTLNEDVGFRNNFSDVFNASYLALYSTWGCVGAVSQTYLGFAIDLRATPPGLPRSGYHGNNSRKATDNRIAC